MSPFHLLDSFPAFLAFWTRTQSLPLEDQIDRWTEEYLAPWPELLSLQIADYAEQGLDWRTIARERVFPFLSTRMPLMQEAHDNLLRVLPLLYASARDKVGVGEASMVIHVGIGCGAGWVTRFNGQLSILFGLENIAEEGWSGEETLTGLAAHEIGHLVHYQRRQMNGRAIGSGPFWQLYEEGFAQHCESLLLGTIAFHQSAGKDADWLAWCEQHRAWLASEFLRRADAGESMAPFFGSWLDIEGWSETGYYLGRRVIEELAKDFGFEEIARLEDYEAEIRRVLQSIAK